MSGGNPIGGRSPPSENSVKVRKLTEYVLDIVRQTGSKLSYVFSLEGHALYVFVSDDPFDALQKILTFCYYRKYRDLCLDDFLTAEIREKIHYVAVFSRVESKMCLNFYVS